MQNQPWPETESTKVCQFCYARIQGRSQAPYAESGQSRSRSFSMNNRSIAKPNRLNQNGIVSDRSTRVSSHEEVTQP